MSEQEWRAPDWPGWASGWADLGVNDREPYVPLSVRYGNRRKKFGWWVLGVRECIAFRLAPWLRGSR